MTFISLRKFCLYPNVLKNSFNSKRRTKALNRYEKVQEFLVVKLTNFSIYII